MAVNTNIEQHLIETRQRIAQAAAQSKRDPKAIRLLAVSKTQPIMKIEEAYRAGQRDFGENRVQELMGKIVDMPDDCQWHLIGRLQTNKVKYLDQRVALIHSLDRLPLLEVLNEQGKRRDIVWRTLVQVNTARDAAKAGLMPEEVPDFLDSVGACSNVQVYGLMTIGALDADLSETRGFFRQLRELRDNLKKKTWPSVELQELSMGMSRDYEVAIEEGATFVRVGRQIFGERG